MTARRNSIARDLFRTKGRRKRDARDERRRWKEKRQGCHPSKTWGMKLEWNDITQSHLTFTRLTTSDLDGGHKTRTRIYRQMTWCVLSSNHHKRTQRNCIANSFSLLISRNKLSIISPTLYVIRSCVILKIKALL